MTIQRGYSTAYTYDLNQRLKKVEDPYATVTQYDYDTLGNLTHVKAAKDVSGNDIYGVPITTIMTYNSLSKKRSMTDPDMGYWTYDYDKSGNLEYQTDAKGQTIRSRYDGLNRVYEKWYGYPTPTSTVYFTYDDPSVPYSKGKQTKVSYQPSGQELREDSILEYDLLQRVKKSKKKIGTNEVTFEKSYDSAGKVISIKYLAGTPSEKVYSYEYDVAGNLLYVKDNASGNHLVDYSEFTALGQQKIATFQKPNNISVKTTYTYDPLTARLKTLLTQKLVGGTPTDTYQDLNYQLFDGKGNVVTLIDNLNAITHSYAYDSLDRLLSASGSGTNPYSQSYQYDRIGNITYKSDVGSYSYTYSSKPHAVRTAGSISLQYDLNGNMTQRVGGGVTITITSQNWNYENKPTLIQKGSATNSLTYDGNGQRVKKVSSLSGTTLYYGELYETRAGVGTIHLFAGSNRVASVLAGSTTQFYHADHLGSASVITDSNGNRKEQMVYFPFGAYRAVGNINGTYDFDANFPDVFYTYTGQEDDDDLGFYNYGARLYDPLIGKFISADTIVPDPNNPQSLNRYSYTLNNPLRYIDPSGNQYDEWDVWYSNTYSTDLWAGYNWGSSLNSSSNQSQFSFGTFNAIPYYSNNIAGNNLAPIIQNFTTNLDKGLSNFYPGFGDSFTSVFGITSLLGVPSPTESIRLSLGCNDVVDKSSIGYKIGEAANAAWWVGLGSAKAGDVISKASEIKTSVLQSIHDKEITLWGSRIINIKILQKDMSINWKDLSVNFVNTQTGSRFEIGYHNFGMGDRLLHFNINGLHYYPIWGWPPWGIK